ncbi:NAD(P)-dependent oxidoreductase [Thalassobaculum sp.]|uniref:NAD(P)-dependent oxidoreductase n=1 Tax=Thalassobaculum sp. TaxID=2022740 RepID=UPI0032EF75AE
MADMTVGWIGIGNMGWPMARNAKRAGVDIVVYDVDQGRMGKFAEEFDAKRAPTLKALAEMSDVIVTIVPDGKIVRKICFGEGDRLLDGLGSGKIVVDMSSSAPTGTRDLGDELLKHGVTLIDAPVSGGTAGADAGTLSIMVGGSDEAAIAKVMPVFEATGKNVFRCGQLGCGHAMKCLNNYLSAVGLTAANEALVIGQKFGLDPSAMIDIINVSTGRNNSTETKYHQRVLNRKYGSGFSAALMAKDIGIAAGLAGDQEAFAPLLHTMNEIWTQASAQLPGVDHEVTIEYYERANATKLKPGKKG